MIRRLHMTSGLAFASLLLCLALLAGCAPRVPLTGTITDAYSGEPLAGVTVRLGEAELTTDSSGSFTATQWTTSDTLEVAAPGYDAVRIALAEREELVRPTPPAVRLDTMLRPNTLIGVVRDSWSGQPLAGALVQATETISTTTAADGSYTLSGLPEQFALQVSAPDYEPQALDLQRTIRQDLALRPNSVTGVVTDRFTNAPVAGALVRSAEQEVQTGADGSFKLTGLAEEAVLEISADGYAGLTTPLEQRTRIEVVLRPDTLAGRLLDAESGEPVQFATIIATQTLPGTDVAFTRIDAQTDGAFSLKGIPETGYLQVLAPGYRRAVLPLEDGRVPETIELQPFELRAVYIKTTTAARKDLMEEFFTWIEQTELNAIVLDLKSDNINDLGLIYYDSQVPIVRELGTAKNYMDIRWIIEEARKRDIYLVARVHIFSHDNVLAEARPDWAAQDTRGCRPGGWRICNGPVFYADFDYAWLDPFNRNVWDYNIQLAVEAAQLGFDEIQFDYIRFPSDARDIEYMQLSQPYDPSPSNAQPMYDTIATFMEQAQRAVNGAGAFFAVDFFGYTSFRPMWEIGQSIPQMAPYADYIYPMVYPSLFVPGEFGFDNPARYPYEVIYQSLLSADELADGKRARIRPWLQAHTMIWVPDELLVRYGRAEVLAQIQAHDDAGVGAGWALWNSDNIYDNNWVRPETN